MIPHNPIPITQYIKEKARITRDFIKRKTAEYEKLPEEDYTRFDAPS